MPAEATRCSTHSADRSRLMPQIHATASARSNCKYCAKRTWLSWLADRAFVTGVGSVQSTRSAQTGIGMLPVAVAQAYP
jgi:hypothetical protein